MRWLIVVVLVVLANSDASAQVFRARNKLAARPTPVTARATPTPAAPAPVAAAPAAPAPTAAPVKKAPVRKVAKKKRRKTSDDVVVEDDEDDVTIKDEE